MFKDGKGNCRYLQTIILTKWKQWPSTGTHKTKFSNVAR